MLKSFQTRLVLFFVALFAVVQALTFYAVQNGIRQNIEEQAKEQLIKAGNVLDRRSIATEDLAQSTSILAADFGFRQAMALEDRATLRSALNNLASRIDADRILLLTPEGTTMFDTGAAVDAAARGDIVTIGVADAPFPFSSMMDEAEDRGRAAAIAVMDDRIYQLVVVPIRAPVTVGWITIGLEIGDAFARDMKQETSLPVDISFGFADERGAWHLPGSTIGADLRKGLAAALASRSTLPQPEPLTLNGTDYVTVMAPISGLQKSNTIYAVLQYSLDEALKPYRSLLLELAVITAAAVLLSVAGAAVVARSIALPILRLDAAAQRIQIGRYTEKVPVNQADEIGRLSTTFNQMMEGISEREEKIAYQARHDMITGLPNRLAFEVQVAERIAACEQTAQRLSVALLQISRFAEINTTLGHDTGDQLLRKISTAVKKCVQDQGFIARHASNMLAIALPATEDGLEIAIIEQLLGLFTEPVDISGATIDVTTVVGMAYYPTHGTTARSLLQHADSAIYMAKRQGVPYAAYDADLDPHKPERLSMMGELRNGLEKGQFKFYFQPKVDIASGTVTAAEALIRWMHPERGLVSPDHFIPLAEQTGNIGRLTAWVLEAAVKQLRAWADKGIDVKIAVNLSARDLMNRHLPDLVAGHLAHYRVPHDRLILEITESAIMEDPLHAQAVLRAFNGMGITLSIDDYGTGYSSLAYLKSLPVQEIKIDKSFVMKLANNLNDEILVRSTIELGHNLGLKVTAEGVEDYPSLAILRAFGCETGQGYHIAKPLPVADFETFYFTSQWSPMRNVRTEDLPAAAGG